MDKTTVKTITPKAIPKTEKRVEMEERTFVSAELNLFKTKKIHQ